MNSCIWILLLLACGGNNCGNGCGCMSMSNRCGSDCGCIGMNNSRSNECGCSREREKECGRENEGRYGRERAERREREREDGCGCAKETGRMIPPPPRSPFEDRGCD